MKKLIVMGCIAGVAFVGCEREGPAERAGKKIDQGVETIKEKAEQLNPEGPAERAGKKIDEATDQ